MQTQDVPEEIIFKLWPWLEANKQRLIGFAGAALAAGLVYYLITSQHAQKEVDAGQKLTGLMVSAANNAGSGQTADALAKLAADYSGTVAGQRAQLQAASTYYAQGNYDKAQQQFENYLADYSAGSLAAVAQLGLGASLEAQGKLDLAASSYKKAAAAGDATVAIKAKFFLARVLESQGKPSDALNYYSEVTRSPAAGSLASEAEIRSSQIKSKLPAPAKSAPALTPAPAPAK